MSHASGTLHTSLEPGTVERGKREQETDMRDVIDYKFVPIQGGGA